MAIEVKSKERFPHVWIANYIADALDLEGVMKKTVEVVSNGKRFSIPSMTSETITPETATAPVMGQDNDYIIYGLERDDRVDLPYKKHRVMSLYVYTNKQAAGMKIVDTLTEYFGDSDAVCRDLNLYQTENGGDGKYKYLSFEYKLLNGPEQLNLGTEGGLYQAIILIAYSYSYPMDSTGISL